MYKLIFVFLLIYVNINKIGCQIDFPFFINGTWLIENSNKYEHWDLLNDQNMKGVVYEMIDNKMVILEYLEIVKKKKNTYYRATPINQNEGKTIEYIIVNNKNVLMFENTKHDFPNNISYELIASDTIHVVVSGNDRQNISYFMTKQKSTSTTTDNLATNANFNSELSLKLGADDYGMKTFFFIILKSGKFPPTDRELMTLSFKGHMDNIQRLVSEEKLIVAGPILKNPNNYRGIFVFNNVSDEAEVKAILETDLAIKNGFLDYDIYSWYGSAALPEYLPFADKIWKLKP